MGASRIEAAVTDAGPLIHLAEINCLSLLRLFEHLYVPQAVWAEIVGYGRVEEVTLLQLENLERHFLAKAEIAQFI